MPSDSKSHSRRELLINGRRVRISDLIEAGLLSPGQELTYQQRIGMEPHRAIVTDRGQLRLADGREFGTPSAAAVAVADVRAVPGWIVWILGTDGPSLHQLRQRLLASVAAEVSHGTELSGIESEAVARRFGALNEARAKAEAGQPITLTVRELLKLWGIEDRDRSATAQIDSDLANHDLTTVPDFRAVSLDHTVRMMMLPDPRDAGPDIGATKVESKDTPPDSEAESSVDIGLALGNLLNAESKLVSVPASATFEAAITAMQLNDFSQLAVLASPHKLHGAVSWKSIAEAKHRNPNAQFSDAIDRNIKVYDYNDRLLDVLAVLQQDGFLFVRGFDGVISGIVTATDVVKKYDETATPFFLIGEVDQELRQLIQNTFDEETVRQTCLGAKMSFRSFGTMTMGHYQAVLENPACWGQLGWPLDRRLFIERLDELRKVRNTVMHFNPDSARPSEVDKLRYFLSLIRRYNV